MKILRVKYNETFKAFKTKKPKINTGKNTCWSNDAVLINGTHTDIFWECMRGAYYYFNYQGQWYKAPFIIGSGFTAIDNLNDDISYEEEWKI